MQKNKILQILFSFLISLLFFVIILKKINLYDLLKVLKNSNLFYIFLSLLLYFLINILRAYRLKIMLKKPIKSLSKIMFIHNFLNNILPFKIGEFSFTILSKKKLNIHIRKSFPAYIITRIFDFINLLFFLIAFLILYKFDEKLFFIALFFILFLISILFILLFYPKLILKFFYLLKKTKYYNFLKEFFENFSYYKKDLILAYVITILIFFVGVLDSILIIKAIGYSVPIKVLLVIIPLASLSGAIPISGLAGFGTFESLWIAGFILFDFELEKAIEISVSIHLIQIAFVIIIGLVGFLIRDNWSSNKKKETKKLNYILSM